MCGGKTTFKFKSQNSKKSTGSFLGALALSPCILEPLSKAQGGEMPILLWDPELGTISVDVEGMPGLNVCVSPKLMCCNPDPKVTVLESQDFSFPYCPRFLVKPLRRMRT